MTIKPISEGARTIVFLLLDNTEFRQFELELHKRSVSLDKIKNKNKIYIYDQPDRQTMCKVK